MHRDEAEDLKRRIADLAAAARDAAGAIEADPDRLTALESRLEQIARLKRKYGASIAEILEKLAALKAEHGDLANIEDALDRRRKEDAAGRAAYREAAAALSTRRARRQRASRRPSGRQGLAMEKARLVALAPVDEDAPALGPRRAPASTRASGEAAGEDRLGRGSSRASSSRSTSAAGAGPGTGARVRRGGRGHRGRGRGRRQKAAGARGARPGPRDARAVIAALADRHYLAEARGARQDGGWCACSGRERVARIARMLAGEKVPETALKHARTLLEAAAR